MAWIVEPKPFGIWEEEDGQCRLHGFGIPSDLRRPRSKEEALLVHRCLSAGYEHGMSTKTDQMKMVLGLI